MCLICFLIIFGNAFSYSYANEQSLLYGVLHQRDTLKWDRKTFREIILDFWDIFIIYIYIQIIFFLLSICFSVRTSSCHVRFEKPNNQYRFDLNRNQSYFVYHWRARRLILFSPKYNGTMDHRHKDENRRVKKKKLICQFHCDCKLLIIKSDRMNDLDSYSIAAISTEKSQ